MGKNTKSYIDELELFSSSTKELKKVEMDFSNFKDVPFFNDKLVNTMKGLFKDFEANLKRFLILNYDAKDKKKPLQLTNEHDLLFKKFVKEPTNQIAKENYISYCEKNNIKVNPKSLDNIEIFFKLRNAIEKNMEVLKTINNIIDKKTESLNTNDNTNDEKIETKYVSKHRI